MGPLPVTAGDDERATAEDDEKETMISPSKEAILRQKMSAAGLHESDLDEQFVRSGGKGGQNVNKVSTCVILRHRPSGLSVKCQEDRSQVVNRYLARRILLEKFEAQILGRKTATQQAVEKIRRQKRRRSRRAKNKMLDDKHHHSQIKAGRSFRPSSDE